MRPEIVLCLQRLEPREREAVTEDCGTSTAGEAFWQCVFLLLIDILTGIDIGLSIRQSLPPHKGRPVRKLLAFYERS